MRLNPLRRKPGWESRDAAERARAITEASHDEVATRLPDFARADGSPEVRRAALKRLDDLALLADRMRHDDDAGVRDAARLRYKEVLVDAGRAVPERERVLRVEDDQDVLAHVATQAREAELRRVALERVTRAGLVVERCQRDPDPEIRLWLLSRIEAPATLERIAESARKSDKLVARVARERLESLKLAAGDPATLRARAHALCDALDALRRDRPATFDADLARYRDEWRGLHDRVDATLARRVDGYFAAFEPPAARSAAEAPPEPEPTPEPTPEALAAAEAARAAAEAAAAVREARRGERQTLTDAVAALERANADGKLGAARTAHTTLAAARAGAASEPVRELAARIAAADEAYEKLVRWQRWSNNKVRSRLCAEIEALAGSGAHPDAVAAKVKEAQAAWHKLDESEGLEGGAAEAGIAKRFRAVCHRALAPTRKYFEKRRELRDEKREAVDALLADAERELGSNPRAAPALRRRVVEALQRLDELDPRVRGSESRKLRALLTRLDAARSERATEIETAKRKLIANLRREVARAPLDEAIEKAKHAQAEWKRLGPAAREVDDALWQELRAIVDPFFEKAGAARAAEQQERDTHATEARAILDELATLAADAGPASHADARVAALTQRWRALPRAPRGEAPERGRRDERGGRPGAFARGDRDDRRGGPRDRDARRGPPPRESYDERAFDRAVDRVRDAQRVAARASERDALEQLKVAAEVCAEVEDAVANGTSVDADAVRTRLDALALPHDARDAIHARCDAAVAADAEGMRDAATENREYAELVAVRAELVGGVESPDSAKALRKRYQLERLAERMRGGTTVEPRAEAREILIEWSGFGPVEREVRDAVAARIDGALKALL